MSKSGCSMSVKLRRFVQEFGERIFSSDGDILFCKLCEVKVSAQKRFNVQQHCDTTKHKRCLARFSSAENRQRLLFETSSSTAGSSKTQSEYCKDLCKMMITSNIPLRKLSSGSLRDFLEKYTSHPIPNESTLRKNYIPACYEDVLGKIRSAVANNKIWVSIDETSDVDGRYIANVIIGTLKCDKPGEVFLLTCENLQKANNSTIAMLFDDSMKLLWPDGVQREDILLFVTDAAPYMTKAAKGLKLLYPKMVHITCLAHGLHRVAEEIRSNYPDVDKLISNGKKMFIKAPLRVQKFKEIAPTLALPPQPVLTRWGTWLDAAMYYCTNYDSLHRTVKEFDCCDSSSIKIVQDSFSDTLAGNLAYIKCNFGGISSAITRLETVGMKLSDELEIVKQTVGDLKQAKGKVAEKVSDKLQRVLQSNPGYSTLCKISDILCGSEAKFDDFEPEFSPDELALFKFAPVTSCDVERSFSRYKNILTSNRRSFEFDNLKMHVIIQCNSMIDEN